MQSQKSVEEGAGSLSLDGDQVCFTQYDERAEEAYRNTYSPILGLLDECEIIEPAAPAISIPEIDFFSAGERIDIEAAQTAHLIFVTEDLVEAGLIYYASDIKRCSVPRMLRECKCPIDDQAKLLEKYIKWGVDVLFDIAIDKEEVDSENN